MNELRPLINGLLQVACTCTPLCTVKRTWSSWTRTLLVFREHADLSRLLLLLLPTRLAQSELLLLVPAGATRGANSVCSSKDEIKCAYVRACAERQRELAAKKESTSAHQQTIT